MSFLIFLFYLFIFALIKLGDVAYRVLIFPPFLLQLLSRTWANLKKEKSKSSAKTIRRNNLSFFDLFSNITIKLGSIILGIVRHTSRIILKITLVIFSPVAFFLSIFRNNKNKKKKKEEKPVNTTIFYKVKYIFIGMIFALVFFFIPATLLIFISDLPKLSSLSLNYIAKTTKIFDRNGTLLFEIYANQNRTIVALDKIPRYLVEATIAIEDKDFYRHSGFDIKGIARAIYVDVTGKDFQGGSTITQQLVKSALLTPEPTISRKAKEIVLAFWAEQKYTKNEILELYFNYVSYGGTAWGIEAASQIYFGKSVSELSLSESAYLAGLPQAPSRYSPFMNGGDKGKARQRDVLNAMVTQGFISQNVANQAYLEELKFDSPQVPIQAPHFVMYIKDLLIKKYGLLEVERGGLQVTTSLDANTQKISEEIVSDEVDKAGNLGVGNGAALVTNPQNGDILAMVGSRDYFDLEHDGNVNVVTSLRQPGSTIKIITYSLALSSGMTEATMLDDTPLTIRNPGAPSYSPVNYDGKYHGKVPLRIAFANSYNVPAVRVAQKFGVEQIVDFGKKMGITSWNETERYGVSITLGAAEVSMTDLATVYGTVANRGVRVEIDPILKVTDSEGKILYEKNPKEEEVLDEGVAYIVSDILADNKARSLSFGPNSPLSIPERKVSVKTGTTDNKRDNWTIGYTPNLLVATWVGNNDNTPLSQALSSGITGAAPVWSRIMNNLIATTEPAEEYVPLNIVSKPCYGYTAFFISGTETKEFCRYRIPTPTFQQQ